MTIAPTHSMHPSQRTATAPFYPPYHPHPHLHPHHHPHHPPPHPPHHLPHQHPAHQHPHMNHHHHPHHASHPFMPVRQPHPVAWQQPPLPQQNRQLSSGMPPRSGLVDPNQQQPQNSNEKEVATHTTSGVASLRSNEQRSLSTNALLPPLRSCQPSSSHYLPPSASANVGTPQKTSLVQPKQEEAAAAAINTTATPLAASKLILSSPAPTRRPLQDLQHAGNNSNNPAAEEGKDPSQTEKQQPKQKAVVDAILKSPITLCFERMLGAAKAIATDRKVAPSHSQRISAVSSAKDTGLVALASASNGQSLKPNHSLGSKRPFEDALLDEDPFQVVAGDTELQRRVILHMALHRQPGEEKFTLRPIPNIVGEGFYWREYPTCEQVLYDHMAEYYNISCIQRLSKTQQAFNNRLVKAVRDAASSVGCSFDPSFTDKKLRDRIRCFYKTHLQNAKKRLVTLQKHPDSVEHQSILRVYIRCVRLGISYEESLYMEPDNQPSKRRGPTKIAKAKESLQKKTVAAAGAFRGKGDLGFLTYDC